jgi:hypothetical protein
VLPADARPASFEAELLALHNAERARVGTAPLSWNDHLAAGARAHARRLAARNAASSTPIPTTARARARFCGSAPPATIRPPRCSAPGPTSSARGVGWPAVGHYTQIVWATTDRVGCGFASGRG